MANYNSGKTYNTKTPYGGAMYNSGPFLVRILDQATPTNDFIGALTAQLTAEDIGTGISLLDLSSSLQTMDIGISEDSSALLANIFGADAGIGQDRHQSLLVYVATVDTGAGTEISRVAKTYFIITPDGILQPLGVLVLRDSREEVMPGVKSYREAIPGRHGEIRLKSEFMPRYLEIHVATPNELSRSELEKLKRNIATKLNTLLGVKNLVFADDTEKIYRVKYSGRINLNRIFTNWIEFTIPFKAGNPFVIGLFEKIHVGSGTLTNEGNIETPLSIEITGPVTNPSIVIGTDTLTWTGTVEEGETLVIDTETMTVGLDGVNAIADYTGGFPKLQPGETAVTAASGGATVFRWRDRWL